MVLYVKYYLKEKMKKIFFSIVIFLFVNIFDSMAQCGPRREYAVEMPIEVGCFNSFKNKDVTLHGYNLDLGLKISRVAVLGSAEFNTFHLGQTNSYCNTFQLGYGASYYFINKENDELHLKFKTGKTVGDSEMKNRIYDVSVGYSRSFKGCGILGAVGFRVCDYKNSYIPDNRFVYISAGLRF